MCRECDGFIKMIGQIYQETDGTDGGSELEAVKALRRNRDELKIIVEYVAKHKSLGAVSSLAEKALSK